MSSSTSLNALLLTAAAGLSLMGCGTTTTERLGLPPVETVSSVDLERYVGTWYEIASYPQSFQKDCTATTAHYEAREDGEIDVTNRCRKGSLDGKLDESKGRARVVDTETHAKLEVSFFPFAWGEYWVIDLAPDYSWSVVGHPSRDYLWILSRTPQLDAETQNAIMDRLEAQGFPLDRLEMTLQPSSPSDG